MWPVLKYCLPKETEENYKNPSRNSW